MHFEFATAPRIVFGEGAVKELAPAARSFGERALWVLGKSDLRIVGLIEQLKKEGLAVSLFHVSGEPTVETVLSGLEQAKTEHCDLVIGMGGGSVIDRQS